MNLKLELLVSLGAFVLFIGATLGVFAKSDRRTALSRLPIFLEAIVFLLPLGLLYSGHILPALAGDRAITVYWSIVFVAALIGLVLAIANLVQRRGVSLNLLAIALAAGWGILLFLGLSGAFTWYL